MLCILQTTENHMRNLFLSLVSLLALSCFATVAQAQTFPYSLADCSIASLSGSSQALVAKNPQRKYLFIFNSGANTAYVNLAGGTGARRGASSFPLSVGSSLVINGPTIDTSAATVIGTSTQPITCYE